MAIEDPRTPASRIKEAVRVVFPEPAGPERMTGEISGRSRREIRAISGVEP
jgi:hypothetical protein